MSKAGTARPKIGPGSQLWQLGNRPPEGEAFVWMTQSMLESPAWSAMTLAARKVLERVMIEHMGHGGKHNGELVVTYDDFASCGVRRSSIIEAIAIAVGLGFLDVTVRGVRSYGTRRVPSEYGLTWLIRRDSTPASNRWRAITDAGAGQVLSRARDASWRPKRRGAPSRDIKSSLRNATGEARAIPRTPVSEMRLGESRK